MGEDYPYLQRTELTEWVSNLPFDPDRPGAELPPNDRLASTIMHDLEISGLQLYDRIVKLSSFVTADTLQKYEVDQDSRAVTFSLDELRSVVSRAVRAGASLVIQEVGEGMQERAQADQELEQIIRGPHSL